MLNTVRNQMVFNRDEKYRYWRVLIALKSEWEATDEPVEWRVWVERKWGFQVGISDISHGYTAECQVVDPKKFMLFRIKYGL